MFIASLRLLASFNGPIASISRAAALTGLAGVAYIAPAQAQGKMADVPSYQAVVTADVAGLHSGNGASFYSVGEVPKGSVLMVDGEDGTWARVSYPAGIGAWVKADEVKYDAGTKTATLTKASSLRALSTLGARTSWQTLFPANKQLPSGTTLKVISQLDASDGSAKGYKVVAPDAARGFIQKSAIRKATPEEAAAAPKAGPRAPETKPDSKPETKIDAPKTSGDSLAEPMTPATDASKQTTPTTAPAVLDQHQGTPAAPGTDVQPKTATPTDGPAVKPEPPLTAPVPAKPSVDLDHIRDAFDKIQKQGGTDEEIQALIGDINKAKEQLASDPNESSRVRQLEVRRAILEARLASRSSVRKAQDATSSAQTESSKVIANVEMARRGGVYSYLGKLETSAVYDGTSLPKLYRVVATGENAGATLGYLKADSTFDLGGKVGQVIGVIGESVMDTTLKVKLIKPSRVDVVGVAWQPPKTDTTKTDAAKTNPAKPAGEAPTTKAAPIRPAGVPAPKPASAPKESDDAADETPQK